MELYDRSNSIDPYYEIGHYMRGKARALVGDSKNAADDFSAAIELPASLPKVKVIAGFLSINQGIARLSRQLRLQAKAELYWRRALARAVIGDWQSAVDDIRWIRENGAQLTTLGYEVEAFALDNLGNATAAISSYELAAAKVQDSQFYGLDEFNDQTKDATWRSFKLATYKQHIANIYDRIGKPEYGAAGRAAAQKLIADAYTRPDLSPESRALLDQFQDPEQRCAAESKFKSVQGILATEMKFVNRYPSAVRLYWVDYTGQRKLYATIAQGATFTQSTYLTHPWLITDLADRCIAIHLPEVGQTRVTIN
jgi:hypothetical protein